MIETDQRKFGLVALLCVALTTSACSPANGEADSSKANSVAADAASADLDMSDCGTGARVTKIDYGVKGEDLTPLRVQPAANAAVVQEQVGNTASPVFIDSSVDVRELCRAKDWSKVRIPSGMKNSSAVLGWVPSSALAKVSTDASGKRIYKAADFDWPAGSAAHRAAVLTVINRIVKQNPACDAINRVSLTMNGTGKAATFLIACEGTGDDQSFEFTAADATNGRSFAPEESIAPISEADAIPACQEAVLKRVNHPSTVDWSLLSGSFETFGNGGARFGIDFSAKNSFNLELTYRATCEFKGNKLTDFMATEQQ